MIKSMTGYGRAEVLQDGYRILVEIKAVNHRYAEVVVRLPREYLQFEDGMKKAVSERISRGRLDVFLTVERTGPLGRAVTVDLELAMQLKRAADELAAHLGLSETLQLEQILKQPGVLSVAEAVENPEELGNLLLACTAQAADNLVEMREREGQRLYHDFVARLEKLRGFTSRIEERSPVVVAEYRERLEKRLRDLLDGQGVEEGRLLTEVAVFADRASIAEELVRLTSHFEQFLHIAEAPEPVGRKLDFLVQEMNREVNTIGSKANDLGIAQLVVEAKSLLEQIREQVQNIE
ncbi:YicC family protein [Tumebacillus sp. ITR2]|uniref:YicC family protein n=1 Tax=Tumebacillus amylolyticus TaxID=2801339 RepID=A0ABS1JFN8_9BACL|nr:YicC/YloC family endoribonuclease [Tumebacillus amylolyticus]MBL0388819.1 YicC family protein [Tumebacillus amylolyticus]